MEITREWLNKLQIFGNICNFKFLNFELNHLKI